MARQKSQKIRRSTVLVYFLDMASRYDNSWGTDKADYIISNFILNLDSSFLVKEPTDWVEIVKAELKEAI